MSGSGGFHHRSGPLKQRHKAHKGVTSKGAQRRALGPGRTSGSAGLSVKAGSATGGKAARLLKAKQLRQRARADAVEERRRGKLAAEAPSVVHLVSLDEGIDLRDVVRTLVGGEAHVCEEGPGLALQGMGVRRLGSRDRVVYVAAAHGDVVGSLDAASLADVVVYVMAGLQVTCDDDMIDDAATTYTARTGATALAATLGDACSDESLEVISALKALGAPTVVGLVLPSDSQKLTRRRGRVARRFFATEFGDAVPYADLGRSSEAFLRLLTMCKRKVPTWRRGRCAVLATAASTTYSPSSSTKIKVLEVTGWVRGAELSARRLVHVPGVGAMRVDRVDILRPTASNNNKDNNGGADDAVVVVGSIDRDRDAEPLEMAATPDDLAGEQTWPTEEELMADDDDDDDDDEVKSVASGRSTKSGRSKRKELMSDYQAAWSLAMDDDDVAAIEEEEDEEGSSSAEEDDDMFDDDDAELDRVVAKKSAAKDDVVFPDEVEVGEDEEARVRFARYRPLQSVRNSQWDPMESLPRDYQKVHRLDRFDSARKRALRDAKEPGSLVKDQGGALVLVSRRADGELRAAVGARVRLVLSCASPNDEDGNAAALTTRKNERLDEAARVLGAASAAKCVVSLHKHENRLSMAHFAVRPVHVAPITMKNDAEEDDEERLPSMAPTAEPLASKDPLLVRCGHREWRCRPIFSTHNLNSDKHQYLRFAREHCVASAYGPVTFAPAPAFFFHGKTGRLVAVGHALDADPNRIVLKRAILTGVPVRTHKRKATIKGMFYNPEDPKFYKPAQLHTKHGLTANITDSIGTHGLFKVHLSRVMKQSDTMMLSLYKRVYPKYVQDDDDLQVL